MIPTPRTLRQYRPDQLQEVVDVVMKQMALRHGSSRKRDFEVATLMLDALLAAEGPQHSICVRCKLPYLDGRICMASNYSLMCAEGSDPVVTRSCEKEEKKYHDAGLAADVNDTGSSATEAASGKDYDASQDVTIEHGALVIRIGVKTLAHACTYSDWANPYDEESGDYIRTFAIVDAVEFAKDIGRAMEDEREDGSSPLTDFIDKMSQAALDDGTMGQHDEAVRIKHGEKSPLETW